MNVQTGGLEEELCTSFFCEIERDRLELGKEAEICEESQHTNGFGLQLAYTFPSPWGQKRSAHPAHVEIL